MELILRPSSALAEQCPPVLVMAMAQCSPSKFTRAIYISGALTGIADLVYIVAQTASNSLKLALEDLVTIPTPMHGALKYLKMHYGWAP